MKSCSGCGKSIGSQAIQCPHCGQSSISMQVTSALIIIVTVLFVWFLFA